MARCAHPDCDRAQPPTGWPRAGLMVDDAWYCSARCVRREAAGRFRDDDGPQTAAADAPRLKLGSLLMHQGAVTFEMVERALRGQRQSGLPLGTELQRLGVAQTAILRALAAQQGVDYLTACDVARVHDAPGGLHPDTVRMLGLVPFDADPERGYLKVACQAPIPRRALEALRRLTRWVAEPFLVTEQVWTELADAYGGGRRIDDVTFTPWCDVDAAAARVASVAESERAVWLQQARCDPFTWVRVEGASAVEDLFVTHTPTAKEESCRQVPTSH